MKLINKHLAAIGIGVLATASLIAAQPEPSASVEAETGGEISAQPASEGTPAGTEFDAVEGPPTVIESDHLKMTTLEEETQFVFSDNVSITTTDMVVYCDRLEVFAGRGGEEETDDEKEDNELGRIQRIFAIGNVRVVQGDREATSGRAEVFPREGKVVLTESPVLRNEDGRVSGARITFYQGEREAVVESDLRQRPRVELPTIPAIGSGQPFEDDARPNN